VNGKISFVNGVAQDFTVTAQNGQQKVYHVIVNTAAEAANLIRELKINDVPGVFSGVANNVITVTLPFASSLQGLAPAIVSDGTVTGAGFLNGKIDVLNNVAQQLTVTAHDGSTKVYDLIVKTAASGATNIQSFKIGHVDGVFSGANNDVITTTLPFATSLLNLSPTIVSDGVVTAPGLVNGALAFVDGVSKPFTVTAPNGDAQVYDVIVKTAANSANSIQSFKIDDVEGVFSGVNSDVITTTLPYNTTLLNVVPKIVSDGVVTAPGLIGGAVSFVSGMSVPFTVAAANGDTKVYNVFVNTAQNTANSIQSFKIGGFDGVFSGANLDSILVKLPFGTLPTGLSPQIAHDGTVSAEGLVEGLIDLIPGQAKTFTVEAANGSKKNYAVTVLVETLQQANEIKTFSLLGSVGQINEPLHTITVAFAQHKDLSNVILPPLVLTNGQSVTQTLGNNDYTKPVAFTAIARDSTSQVYPLTIVNPPAL
jgi:hypothetical protein